MKISKTVTYNSSHFRYCCENHMRINESLSTLCIKYNFYKKKVQCQYNNEAIPYLVDLQLYDAGDKLNV